MMKKCLLGLMLASAAATMSSAAYAADADATEAARALLSGRNAPAASVVSTDARTATESAQATLSGRHLAPSTSARGVDTLAGAQSADERARALLSASSSPRLPSRPLSRADVLADVERVRQAGSWRCLTNNRGWCGVIGL